MVVVEKGRPVVCYQCGTLLGLVKAEWTQDGMSKFRERAEALKKEHVCNAQDTRNPTASVGKR